MLLKTLQFTVRNLRSVKRLMNVECICTNIQAHSYGGYAPRKYKAIVNEDELFDVEENITPAEELKKFKAQASKSRVDKTQKGNSKSVEVSFDDDTTEPKKRRKPTKDAKTLFTKVHENDKIASSILMSIKSQKKRKKNEQILLEGLRLIEDAMEVGIVPQYIFFSRWEDIKHIDFPKKDTKLFKLTYKTIQLWSSLTTSPGVMGIFKKPEPLKLRKSCLPITVICDNVRDPGNMGSILRAAAGIGVEKVILTKGCVDFWNTKVLRAASGAHFRVPVFDSQEWEDIKLLLSSIAQVYVADNKIDVLNQSFEETEKMEDHSEEEEETELEEETEVKEEIKQSNNKKPRKISKKEITNALLRKYSNLPVVPYYCVDYTQNEVILIIGGETEGLSQESYELIEGRQGVRVNIPLDNNIDSLNAGMALGIIAFEVKRQYLRAQNALNQPSS